MGQKVLIAEHREVIRTGLRTIFEKDIRVADVYEVDSSDDLQRYLSHPLDLVIIHQSLVSNIEILPAGKFVLLVDKPDIEMLTAAYEHHARGYLSENVSIDLLLTIINPKSDAFLLDPTFFPWMITYVLNENKDKQEVECLSPREREVVSLLKKGMNRRSVAQQLHISEATLKTHIKNINRKKEDTSWLSAMALEQRYVK